MKQKLEPQLDPVSGNATPAIADNLYVGVSTKYLDSDWSLAARLVVGYEPVWAIGAAEPAGAGYVSGLAEELRARLADHGLEDLAVIYGGSAKPGLLPMLDGVDGLFLGRFAHDPANFGKVLDEALDLSPE